jgi:trimeric autotransporter adhesin
MGGLNSGWQSLGTWSPTAAAPPQAVSVSPSSGSGSSQTFSFVYSDAQGASDISVAQVIINGTLTYANGCYIWTSPAAGSIWLYNDATSSWMGPSTLGTAGTLQNNQCMVNVGASSRTLVGNVYTLNLAITFQSGFVGTKGLYGYASSAGGLNSGWQALGNWTH